MKTGRNTYHTASDTYCEGFTASDAHVEYSFSASDTQRFRPRIRKCIRMCKCICTRWHNYTNSPTKTFRR